VGARIAQVANFYGPTSGGLRTTVDALGRGYEGAGHERVLVVPGRVDADEDTASGRRITMRSTRLPGTPYRVLARADAVAAVIAEVAPDSLEVSDKLTLRRLGAWARRRGIPTVLVSHERIDAILSPRVPGLVPLRAVADRWNRGLVREFDAIVCASNFSRAEFDRIGATNVRRIPLGVDLDVFRPRPERIDRSDHLRLVCVGRLSKEKRPELAVETLRLLARAGTDAHLTIVGDGPERGALEAAAAQLPVTFAGHVDDRRAVAELVADADVALAPCPYETFGLAALEALACGTPVVCADAGATPELIVAGRNQVIGAAAPTNPGAFAAAVARIGARCSPSMRHAARARAEEFPWSRTVRSMLALHGVEPAAMVRAA
jgi:alpha-1,6-mannosyltransferase